jgi:PAS domain S-box-containing protein
MATSPSPTGRRPAVRARESFMSQRPQLARQEREDGDVDAALRANIEASADTWVVYRTERDADGLFLDLRVEYANTSYWEFTGLDRRTATGRGIAEITPELRWVGTLGAMRKAAETGEAVELREVRQVRQLGPNKGATYVGTVAIQPLGELLAVSFRDATEVLEAKAAAVLSASQLEAIFESTPIAMHVYDFATGTVRGNRAALALLGYTAEEVAASSMLADEGSGGPQARWEFRATFADLNRSVLAGEPIRIDELELTTKSGHQIIVSCHLAPAFGPEGDVVAAVTCFVDLTETKRLTAERDKLAGAIEQAAESVEITDLEGRISYVNPSFERVTGYRRDEVVGKSPAILKSGVHTPAFYEAMWATLNSGAPWIADFVNRRKDGSLFTEAAVITPIKDAAGNQIGYVSVKRDVTNERVIEERSARLLRERALIADTIRGLRTGDTVEETAQAICRQVVGMRELSAAQIFIFELDGRAVPIGFVVAGSDDPPLRRLPRPRSRYLHERAEQGPWIEPWVERGGHPYNRLLSSLGTHVVGYAPIRHEGRVIGLLVVDAAETVDEASLAEEIPAIVEFADLAGAVVGSAVGERTEVRRSRDRIAKVIIGRAYHPVFQPIVELDGGAFVGYEALTRFDDNVAPDVRFDEAAAVGIGMDLELATLREALAASIDLPKGAWLNLNCSPELIMSGSALRGIIENSDRAIVLEVTEHAEIADYQRFKEAIRALGPHVRLAVDDAGAGYSSLRHILELRPAFVKLDRSIVTGLESDEVRRAMVAGLKQFARSTGSRIIPEGIETQAELEALRSLDVKLGQGFLLGRPVPSTSLGILAP